MSNVTVIGFGSIGSAVAGIAVKAGSATQVLVRDPEKVEELAGATIEKIGAPITGEVVVLALPYPAIAGVIEAYGPAAFAGKIVVDPSNPVDFETLDSVVAPGSSAAAEIAAQLPGAKVVKAFNTNFAATLASGTAAGQTTVVSAASDSAEAKDALRGIVEGAGLKFSDAGELKRAARLEAIGIHGVYLAVTEQISWTGGLLITK